MTWVSHHVQPHSPVMLGQEDRRDPDQTSGKPPHALSLEALARGGAALTGIPVGVSDGPYRGKESVRTFGHLMEAGLLPVMPPRPREGLHSYLHRITRDWKPHGFALDLEPYQASGELAKEPPEQPGLLVLSLTHEFETTPINGQGIRRTLNRLHPRFFGSLMVHLSQASDIWPIFTVYDAMETAKLLRYDGADDFRDFWHFLKEDFHARHGRSPRGPELQESARELVTPRQLFSIVGVDEVLPTLKRHLRLSPGELSGLAHASTGPYRDTALNLLDMLAELHEINALVRLEMTDDEYTVREATGELRVRPLAAVSGQHLGARREWHEVYELQLEDEQMADAGRGYCQPFTLLLRDQASAHHAVRLLKLFRRSLDLMADVLHLLDD